MRGSLVPLAVCVVASGPRCRSIPSFERFFVCSVLPHGALLWRRPCIWRVAPMVGVAPTRRGARCPRSRFRSRGPNSPRLPPGYAQRVVVATLRFCRLPPAPYHPRHAPWALRPQAARGGGSSRARFGGMAAGACVCQGALFPRWSAAFIGRWSPMGCSKLRYTPLGAPHRLAPARQTQRARRGRRTPYPAAIPPKRFCPLEPLTPHAACARTRPRFARPLPRFRGLAPRGSLAAVGSLSD